MDQIFARFQEIKGLEQIYISGKAEFLAIYGRRRIGKTFLIREFFKNKGLYFALTGVKDASKKKQLQNFIGEYSRVFGRSKKEKQPMDWSEAFNLLRKGIEKIKGSQRIIIFMDELPWLAGKRSGFLQDLDHFWNHYLSSDNRIILIVCGSAASWMIRKIVRDKGGLHGRLTAEMRLLPFDLRETEEYLHSRGINLNRKDVIEIYMAIGGIPKYLSYIQRGMSAIQIVGQLCFNGILMGEFEELYSSLFESHQRHVNIVKTLAKFPGGLSKTEIARACGMTAGGGLNMILDELEQSGFILSIREFGKQKKESRFKLIDEYSLFYLRWSLKFKESNLDAKDETFWMTIFNSPNGRIWAGYAFEMLCLKHIRNIKKALGIAGVLTSASSWVFRSQKGSIEKGVQIDLLIDRADNCINLCEIKYCNEEFVITKKYDRELREKKTTFQKVTKTLKSIFITILSPYGVKKNIGYFGTADLSLTLNDLF